MNLFAACKPLTLQQRVLGNISNATFEKANPKDLVSPPKSQNLGRNITNWYEGAIDL